MVVKSEFRKTKNAFRVYVYMIIPAKFEVPNLKRLRDISRRRQTEKIQKLNDPVLGKSLGLGKRWFWAYQ